MHHRQLDVADLESLQPFVAQVIEFGSLDLVLPNAGIGPVRMLPEIDLTTWQETLTVNLTAPFLLARAALPDTVNRGYGRILFTSSAVAFVGGFIGPHYAASKAALHGLVASLASNYAPYGSPLTRSLPPSSLIPR